MRLSHTRHFGVVTALLLLFVAAGANSLVRESATFDETAHLPAGFTYLDRGDFRLNPEHPPLSKVWAALPLWLFADVEADYDSRGWNGQPLADDPQRRSKASEWLFGYEWLNGPRGQVPRNNPLRLLLPARAFMLIPGVLLGLIVYAWSRELWGREAGLVSLLLYCISPTMLAHTRLVTTDMPAAFGFVLCLWCFWRVCRAPSRARAAAAALAFGVSVLIKFSALLLVPMLLGIALLWIVLAPGAVERRLRIRWAGGTLLGAGLVGYGCLWVGYGLRFAAAADPAYVLDWDVIGLDGGPALSGIRFALAHHLAPEGYLYGLAYFLGGSARRLAYFHGEQSLLGWWYYFPVAMLLKTPPGTLLLAGWLAVVAVQRRLTRSFDGWCLAIPIGLYLLVSISSHLNIGHRHLTPIYPLLFVLLGALAGRLNGLWQRVAWGLLIVSCGISFMTATPGYLSYFNALAGGSRGGARYLLDSNLDWGQDLPALAHWMRGQGLEEIHLAYFGTADPEAYGIRYRKVHQVHDFNPERTAALPPSGALVAVSVNLLHGLYVDEDRDLAEGLLTRGWVAPEPIQDWLDLRDRLNSEGQRHPDLLDWLRDQELVEPRRLEVVRSGLLSTWFAELREGAEPLAWVGGSIVVYRSP